MSELGPEAPRKSSEEHEEDDVEVAAAHQDETAGLLSSDEEAQRILKNGSVKWVKEGTISTSKSQRNRFIFFFAILVVTVCGFVFLFNALIGPCGSLNSRDCLVQEQQPSPSPSPPQEIAHEPPPETPHQDEHEEEEPPKPVATPSPSPVPKPKPSPAASFRRPQSDYLLNPNWDSNASPATRHYYFTISDVEVNPDGVYRPMILINGQFPGPLIQCNEGDRLVIHVQNNGVNATSLHWHGLFQNGTNWMDGTVGVTQCPIAPGGNFTYDFTIRGQHGTYWYHSHHGLQASDGVFGPLVVHSPQEKENQKIPYATDRVLMFQDYYHDLSGSLLPGYLANDRENNEPVPDGALINGANIRDCSGVPSRRCDNSSAYIPTFNLAPNQNHRLRIINTAALAEFQIQIDEHYFAVTEVDGTDVLPHYINRLKINTAQRYSLIVTTNVTTTDAYWLRARMVDDCFSNVFPNPNLIPRINAIIQYRDESDKAPTIPTSKDWDMTIEQICRDLNTTGLVPVPAIAAPPHADEFHFLAVNFKIGAWRLSRGYFNETSFRPDLHSSMLGRFVDKYNTTQELSSAAQKAFHHRVEKVLQIEGIKTVDILMLNVNEGNHPIHLHGYKFFVLGQGHGYFDYSTYDSIDVSNPLRRDTASLEGYGWMLIRVVTDNPGLWALHCHIAWHSEAGLQMQLLTRGDIAGSWTLPQDHRDLCKAEGLEKGAAPPDEIYFGNTG
ncbi:L-ascorbate oxidase [Xylogone sp. PMI_703]|nr:L-ascorbate oxidase [Xylogone sp. PMI_703]